MVSALGAHEEQTHGVGAGMAADHRADVVDVDLLHAVTGLQLLGHADCEVEARAVAEEMKARYGVKEVYINYIGPVIGSHTGPNTMGIFFVGTKR